MDTVPNYTAVTDLPLQWQGDTLPAMGFQIDYPDATPMIPESVCAVLMNKAGVAVWTYDANIDPVTGRVVLPEITGVDAQNLRSGGHSYAVKYIMAGGYERTYFTGSIQFKAGAPKC